jgi:hypothetical protein
MLSEKLVRKCFPHKEAVLYNLDVALSLLDKNIYEEERVTKLVWCYESLRKGDIDEAVKHAERAGYRCMAQAIRLYF